MNIALELARFALAFMDKAPALIKGGMDLTAAYQAHRAKVMALAEAGSAPTEADWDEMHASLKPLEDGIQAAHRDVA